MPILRAISHVGLRHYCKLFLQRRHFSYNQPEIQLPIILYQLYSTLSSQYSQEILQIVNNLMYTPRALFSPNLPFRSFSSYPLLRNKCRISYHRLCVYSHYRAKVQSICSACILKVNRTMRFRDYSPLDFQRATALCCSALYVIARPSVHPSHGWISQRRLKLGSCNLHHKQPHDSSFLTVNFTRNSKGNILERRRRIREGQEKIRNFQQISRRISETV